ncbi:MAG TPA: helix-turn-helix domain-containing protein [Allosphingosinicella sp.]|jgi:excisionase family DNA binding protein|nr:helix-turn-helix domain-containing protein [Allosphingosinicella sp.]
MSDGWYFEAEAARQLAVHERTLRRWRKPGKVPFCRTPGGRIRYTFAQLVEIGAGMVVAANGAAAGRTCPDMSGELPAAAE